MRNIYFLHGFLGLPSDWVATVDEMHRQQELEAQIHLLNLWNTLNEIPVEKMFTQWTNEFAKDLQGTDNWLVGYSMGGRILLNLPENVWDKVAGLVLISSHLGLEKEKEQITRLEQDLLWAKKFREMPWADLMGLWNGQEVFHDEANRPERYEEDYKREHLAKAIDGWSLGRQKDFTNSVSGFPFPVHYLYGDKDKKFSALAQKYSAHLIQPPVALPSGHSPLFSSPKNLARVLGLILAQEKIIN